MREERVGAWTERAIIGGGSDTVQNEAVSVRDVQNWCLYGRDQETGTWSRPAGVTFDHIRQDSHGPSHAPSTSVQPTVAVAFNTLKRQGELLLLRYPSYAFWGHDGRHRDRYCAVEWAGRDGCGAGQLDDENFGHGHARWNCRPLDYLRWPQTLRKRTR